MPELFFERQPYSKIAILSLVAAVLAVGTIAAAPLGFQQGWWNYPFAIARLTPAAALLAIVALGLALVGAGHAWFGGPRRGKRLALVAATLALVVLAPVVDATVKLLHFPAINDVSTTPEQPLAFIERKIQKPQAQEALDSQPSATPAEQQRCAYPDIQPYYFERPSVEVFDAAKAIAADLGWQLMVSSPVVKMSTSDDPLKLSFEAVAQSSWYRFRDDIVVVVTSESEKTRLDIRSASRVGKNDMGANAARIKGFVAALSATLD